MSRSIKWFIIAAINLPLIIVLIVNNAVFGRNGRPRGLCRCCYGGPHHNEKVDWLAPGEGGGGGGSLSGNIKIIKAKKIFRNSKMTDDDWATLEDLINKIMETCMGENLYNGLVKILDGKTYVIEITNKKRFFFQA